MTITPCNKVPTFDTYCLIEKSGVAHRGQNRRHGGNCQDTYHSAVRCKKVGFCNMIYNYMTTPHQLNIYIVINFANACYVN